MMSRRPKPRRGNKYAAMRGADGRICCTLALGSPLGCSARSVRKRADEPDGAPTVHRARRARVRVADRRRRRGRSCATFPSREPPATAAAVFGVARVEVDEHVHVRRGDSPEHILLMKGRTGGGMALAAAHAQVGIRPAAGEAEARRSHCASTAPRASSSRCATRSTIESLLTARAPLRDGGRSAGRSSRTYVEVKGVAGRIDRGAQARLERQAGVAAGGGIRSSGRHLPAGISTSAPTCSPGDEFRIIYENVWEAWHGRRRRPARSSAPRSSPPAPHLTAVLFEAEDGSGGYYTPDGAGAVARLPALPGRVPGDQLRSSRGALPSHPAPLATASRRRPRGAAGHRARRCRRLGPGGGWMRWARPGRTASSTVGDRVHDLRPPERDRARDRGGRHASSRVR